jgi:S1-C subfamily serine protease
VSVTVGVVSRVEPQQYTHGAMSLLAVQIDAAINPGNSGGPVLQDGRVVGLAFQAVVHAENIGFIIPTPIVRYFLDDIARFGQYKGFCSLGVRCQALDNAQLRQYMRLGPGQTGVLVGTVFPLSAAAAGGLRAGDVLLAFDGVPIANDGSVPFRGSACGRGLRWRAGLTASVQTKRSRSTI